MSTSRKRIKIMLATLSLLLVLFLLSYFLLPNMYVGGFKQTLVTLVKVGTDNAFDLEIGETNINHFDLSFSLHQLKIYRVDSANSVGIKHVEIPNMKVDIGSLMSWLRHRQFKIDELSISEPIATIGLRQPDQKLDYQRVNLAHKIAQFYPALKAFLDELDIGLFRIDRASISLSRTNTTFQVRLLDLLVSNWNMRELSNDAKFQLSLGDQKLAFTHSDFSFESLVYDYHKNELDVLNFSYSQIDTSQVETVHAEGKALKIINLDYQLLISEEQYHLDSLLIIEPKVVALIHPKRNKQKKVAYPLADMLKKNFGTLEIGDAEVLNASLDLSIFRKDDTVSFLLPKLNLFTEGFRVDEDSATVMIDNLHLDVHETELSLSSRFLLRYQNLDYDEDYNLSVDSIELEDRQTGNQILYGQQMNLYHFDVFRFIYDHEVSIDSIDFDGATINVSSDFMVKRSKPTRSDEINVPIVDVGRVRLHNMNVNLALKQVSGELEKVSARLDDVRYQGKFDFDIRYLKSTRVSLNQGDSIDLSISGLSLEPKSLRMNTISGVYHHLSFEGRQLFTSTNKSLMNQPKEFEQITVDQLSLSGHLPNGKKNDSDVNTKASFSVKQLKMNQLDADLTLPNTGQISGSLSNTSIINGGINHGMFSYEKVTTGVTSFRFRKDSVSFTVANSNLATDSVSVFNKIQIENLKGNDISIHEMHAYGTTKSSDALEASDIKLSTIEHSNADGSMVSSIDSIRLLDFNLPSGAPPFFKEVQVYSPDITLKSKNQKNANVSGERSDGESLFNRFERLRVHPGILSVDNNIIRFDRIFVDSHEAYLTLDLRSISFKDVSSSIHIGRVSSNASELFIDSIFVIPTPEYVQSIKTETDVIAAQLGNLTFKQLDWKPLTNEGLLVADSLLVDGVNLSIKRDKTLPDPEHLEKPYLLEEFIPNPEQVDVPIITVKNGRMDYIEVGEKTGQEGHIYIDSIEFSFRRTLPLNQPERVSFGRGAIYNQGLITYDYHRLDSGKFSLDVTLSDFDLEHLNKMVDPLEAAKIKSGHLEQFRFNMIGDSLQALGKGTITYDDLHVEIFKSHQPDVKNFGSTLLTLLVDKIILKHSKTDASADFAQDRITFKGPINYWVKSGIHAASATVIKGKAEKKRKRRTRDNAP